MIRKYGVSSHSNLYKIDEITRKNMVGKTKVQSPDRYNKRLHYHATGYDIDFEKLLSSDFIVAKIDVGDYICTVAYKGVLSKLVDIVEKTPRHYSNLQAVIKALNQSIDETDILIDCDCGDFKYRFAYWATKYGYKYGKPETRSADVRNPDDKLGAMCKHLTSILANKKWLTKLASVLNSFIRDNADEIRSIFKLSPEEFIVNPLRFGKLPTINNSEEELEPKVGEENGSTNEE